MIFAAEIAACRDTPLVGDQHRHLRTDVNIATKLLNGNGDYHSIIHGWYPFPSFRSVGFATAAPELNSFKLVLDVATVTAS